MSELATNIGEGRGPSYSDLGFLRSSDFPVVWTSQSQRHSLLSVSTSDPFFVHYRKAGRGAFFTLEPTTYPQSWTLKGRINADTIAHLGLQVSAERFRDIPPAITDHDIEVLKDSGWVDIPDSAPQYFDVALWLQTRSINRLFSAIWVPTEKAAGQKNVRFNLYPDDSGRRTIPEKFGRSDESTIQVIKGHSPI